MIEMSTTKLLENIVCLEKTLFDHKMKAFLFFRNP